ncbi:N-acetylmuramate alpha-1-phosphate uridylyltransferase MurU [Thiothrix lacustris]|uniref:N-acetylmuramate alpha-1-phosphate uridylyltransferase MurU n=1 Tax=Thiothrix lacustris TaxID=525917 RepID=UPI0027E4CBA0|nr:nucleotidyltransferase family protein [Thiothrix lacustris]WMP16217.1 nucleotidyltransferase family protein [Thiothrix lacustris]
MKAMILAAGHGTRMRPLTDHTPKPLLQAGGKSLIVWHIEKLARAGFRDIIINLAWLGWKIPAALGDGSRWNVTLHYSDEQSEGALETAGGILKALPLLGNAPFLVVNGDVWCDYPCLPYALPEHDLAHLVLVNNPAHNPQGDFALSNGRVANAGKPRYTFSGIGYYHPALFAGLSAGKHPLAPLLRAAMDAGQVSGEWFAGDWRDIGTPERLAALDRDLTANV